MRVVIAKAPLIRLLRWTRRALLALSLSLLAYCGFVVFDAWNFQRAAERQLARLTTNLPAATRAARSPELRALRQAASRPAPGSLMGRMEIPRLGVSVVIMEGTTARTLRRAVGHIAGTALPGQPGNVGVSGHRDTFFRPLRNILAGDIVNLTTPFGAYRYRVLTAKVVRPDNVAVLRTSGEETLTLVTCYPFYFVGPAPSRFIVRAERVIEADSVPAVDRM